MRTTLRLLITAARAAVMAARWLFIASRLTARGAAAAAVVAEDIATHAVSYHAVRRAELAARQAPAEETAPHADARTQPAPAAGSAPA